MICFPIECKRPKARGLCLFSHCVFQALRRMNQQVRANFQAQSMVAWSHQMRHLERVVHPLPFLFKTVARRQAVCMGQNALKSCRCPGFTSPSDLCTNRNVYAISVLKFSVQEPQNSR